MRKGMSFKVALASSLLAPAQLAVSGASDLPATKSTQGAVEAAVQQVFAHVTADLAREGPTAWIGYFDENPRFLMAADGQLEFDGIAAARTFLAEFGKHIVRVQMTWHDLRVDALDSNLATFAAAYSEALTDNQGGTLHPHGYVTGLVVRTSDGWKFRSLHWSSTHVAP